MSRGRNELELVQSVENLFAEQLENWPGLARGVEGLARAQTRSVRIRWFDVFARNIPHRVTSTTAAVDAQSIAQRPCFLCAGNLYPEQRGLPFDGNYTLYCNPFPIVERHLTIVHREHRPQLLAGEFGAMLDLAAALPGYFIIYNGPECGASAPDHLHFQAGTRALFPIEKDTAGEKGIAVRNYSRNVFLFRQRDRGHLIETVGRTIDALAGVTGRKPEPLINIALSYNRGEWTVYVFPRDRHRPAVFLTGELTVSPATIDLCGIFVVPLEKDFARISGADIDAIFKEVTLRDAAFEEVVSRLQPESPIP
jgi:uncharacterized protein DUF4922